jgi:hypothetical protein
MDAGTPKTPAPVAEVSALPSASVADGSALPSASVAEVSALPSASVADGSALPSARASAGPLFVSVLLLVGFLGVVLGVQRVPIMANWATYRMNPFYLMMAPFLKPSEDPRTNFQFASDNYSEVLKIYMDKAIAVLMTPVYKVFEVLSSSIASAVNGVAGVRALLANLFRSFQSMVDIFMRRFGKVGSVLTDTFRKLFQAMERTWAVAISSVYAALSTIHAMKNMISLMVTIASTILIILAVLVFFFFFSLWPLMPLIVMGGMMVTNLSTTLGIETGAGGAIRSLSCFDPATPVLLADGSTRPIADISPGLVLEGGTVVEGSLHFQQRCDVYSLYGVVVTGSHLVYDGDRPLFVADHPEARLCGTREAVVCLLTSTRRIPIQTPAGLPLSFADWEELGSDDTASLQAWYENVYATLNGGASQKEYSEEEAGVSGSASVEKEFGWTRLDAIRPGESVRDASGAMTQVTCVVTLGKGTRPAVPMGDGYATIGCWKHQEGRWDLIVHTAQQPQQIESSWYHLFTESGTFVVKDGSAVGVFRDFSDLGSDLPRTYADTLAALQALRPSGHRPFRPQEKTTPLESHAVSESLLRTDLAGPARARKLLHDHGLRQLPETLDRRGICGLSAGIGPLGQCVPADGDL